MTNEDLQRYRQRRSVAIGQGRLGLADNIGIIIRNELRRREGPLTLAKIAAGHRPIGVWTGLRGKEYEPQ
jgi:hypothetical protein